MPYINVTVTGEPDAALSQRIAAQVSDLTKQHLRKDPTVTAVSISYIDPNHWFAGGRSLAGTNMKTEMAAYLEAVFAGLSATLGNVHEESYILVHEVPAAAYGYGGKTQEHRFISGRMKAAA